MMYVWEVSWLKIAPVRFTPVWHRCGVLQFWPLSQGSLAGRGVFIKHQPFINKCICIRVRCLRACVFWEIHARGVHIFSLSRHTRTHARKHLFLYSNWNETENTPTTLFGTVLDCWRHCIWLLCFVVRFVWNRDVDFFVSLSSYSYIIRYI